MNRRRYVSAIGSTLPALVLAGCVSDGTADDGNDNGDPASGIEFSLTPLTYEDEDQWPVSYSASLSGGGYDDPDGPIGIDIRLANVSGGPLSYGERRDAQFHGVRSDDGRFALYPGDWDSLNDEVYEFEGDCWNRTEPYVTTDDYQIGELEPGASPESASVVSATATESCPDTAPQAMTFRTSVTVWESQEDHVDVDDGNEYEWGFELSRTGM